MQNIEVADVAVRPEKLLPIDQRYLAPWWHTVLFVLLLAAVAGYGGLHGQMGVTPLPNSLHYLSSIIFEWMLLATAVAGLYHRRTFFNTTVLQGNKPIYFFYWELLVGVGIFVAALVLLLVVSLILRFTPLEHTFNHKAVTDLMPGSGPLFLLWIPVSLSAGFCEEMIFRGYLQRQLCRWTGNMWFSICVQAILFACMHVYQGAAGAVVIGVLGLFFGIIAERRGNLRAVIVAHSLQDFFVGLVYYGKFHAR